MNPMEIDQIRALYRTKIGDLENANRALASAEMNEGYGSINLDAIYARAELRLCEAEIKILREVGRIGGIKLN